MGASSNLLLSLILSVILLSGVIAVQPFAFADDDEEEECEGLEGKEKEECEEENEKDDEEDDKDNKKHKVFTGDGPPPDKLGEIGDGYIDNSSDDCDFYIKTAKKTWTFTQILCAEPGTGPAGADGATGPAGADGSGCTVTQNVGSATITCDDGSTATVFDGEDAADVDQDTIPDSDDNCPFDFNPNQDDTDVDGIGNACDPDDDNDTVLDGADNCPLIANTDQSDIDFDGIGDLCDGDPNNNSADTSVTNLITTGGAGSSGFKDKRVTVSNFGPTTADNVVVFWNTIPSSGSFTTTLINGGGFTCTIANNDVTCTISSLTAGSSTNITIKVSGAGACLFNSVSVSSDDFDPNSSNNSVGSGIDCF